MNAKGRITRSAICLAQTLLLLTGNASMVLAASSANSELDGFERSVFGEVHSQLSENSRLKDLEVNLFGKSQSGTTAARIAGISKALGGSGKNDNLLLPALAPQLDRATEHVQSAPSKLSDADLDTPISASGDAEKEVLRSAMKLYAQGKTDEAEKQFRKALSLNKNSADAYYNLGVIAEGRGDLSSALNHYRSAARINPSDTDLASAISSLESKLQDKANATQRERQLQQQQALEHQQTKKTEQLKQMINVAASAYKAGDYDKAISNLESVSQQAPGDGDVLYALGQAYKGKGDFGKARNAYYNAIASDPSNNLYKDALASLNRAASNNRGSGSAGDANANAYDGGMPQTAPDRKRGKPGQLTGFSGTSAGSDSGGSTTDLASNGSQAGQLTPFSGMKNGTSTGLDDEFNNITPGGIQYGYTSSTSGRGLMGLGSGLGSLGGLSVGLLGAGGMGSMLGGGVRYSGFRSGSRYGGSSTRIKRAAIGGLTGAAAGAMYGRMGGRGNMKSSAMKGALMGAAMGLFMGGY